MRKAPFVVALLCMTSSLLPLVRAQAPAFGVVSVKPNKSANPPRVDMAGGRLNAIAVTLRDLLRMAYPASGGSIRGDDQLLGGPSWIGVDRFDVIATGASLTLDSRLAAGAVAPAEEGAALTQLRAMMENLLADRFKVSLHHETRDFPNYRLVVARSDAKPGSHLRPSNANCVAEWRNGAPPPEAMKAGCGGVRILAPGRLTAHAVTLSMLVSMLSNMPVVGRIVDDQTGFSGTFDLDLTWAPNNGSNPDAPSIFTALQEQLGLRLDSSRGPVDVLVIDRAEHPTPD